jgi:hypothetical protein
MAVVLGPLSFLAQLHLNSDTNWHLRDMLFSPSGIWLLCAFVSPAVLVISRRWPFAGPRLARRVALHLLMAPLL